MANTISFHEALDQVLVHAGDPTPVEEVSLGECLGRSLAAEIRSNTPWPTTDRSAMDGFAVYASDAGLPAGTVLPVVGESLAGHPFSGAVAGGAAIRIMTGAVVPGGVDAVVPVERTSGYEGEHVTLDTPVRAGDNVRLAGSEVAAGESLIAAGARIRAAEVGALAVLGTTRVAVHRRPVVAILSTGDEVVPVESEPEEFQVRDSNSWSLAAQIVERGAEPLRLGIAPDRPDRLRELLARGLAEADVLLTIGGVAKGTHDLVHGALAELAVAEVFHGVALKPGKPTFFGTRAGAGGTTRYVFGLPGNPASCFSVFDLLVAPLLAALSGERAPRRESRAVVGGTPFRENWRLQAIPATLRADAEGHLCADLQPFRPSGDPFGLLAADGYALIPAATAPGTVDAVVVRSYGVGMRP